MTIAIENFTAGGANNASTSSTVNYTTSGSDRVVILSAMLTSNSPSGAAGAISSITDTGGLTWTRRKQYSVGLDTNSNYLTLEVWWAYAPAAAASKTLTVNYNSVHTCALATYAISGLGNPASPWDSNTSLPATASNITATASTPSVSGISTSATSSILLANWGHGAGSTGAPAVGTGFTLIGTSSMEPPSGSDRAYMGCEYQLESAAQTSITATASPSSVSWLMVVDALSGDAPTATTWNPADHSPNVALSNGNHTATSTTGAGNEGGRSTTYKRTGKWYVEFSAISDGGNFFGIGLGGAADSITSNGQPLFRLNAGGSVNIPNGSSYTAFGADPGGHTVGMAFDLDNNRAWMRYDGGPWYGNAGSGADITVLTSGFDITGRASPSFLKFCLQFAPRTVTLNAGDSAFANAPPAGFAAWSGVNSPWASVEAPDVFSARGYPGYPGTRGDWLSTEAADTFSAHGYQTISGTLIVSEAPDKFSAYGRQPLSGRWASTEAPDIFAGTGIGRGEDGRWLSSEAPDVFAATGTVPISGRFASTEAADRFVALGAGVIRTQKRVSFFVT